MTDYKISALTAASPALADLLAFVDVDDTSTPPAGAGGSDKSTTVAALGTAFNVVQPTGDTSGTDDTAAINAVTEAGKIAFLMPAATYHITNILLESYGGILGNNATLSVVTGTTGYAVALKTPASTKQVVVQDLVIQCNDVCAGVLLDNTGFTPAVQWVPYDPLHSLRNVFVMAANGDGWHLDNNARGLSFQNCRQYFASGYGFYLGPGAGASGAGATDCNFDGCISGQSGNHGYYVDDGSSDNMFANCKAFYSGFVESTGDWGTTECGFEIIGAWNTFVGCNAQQAALHGFDLNEATYCTITGCDADTNSAGTGVTTGVGININGTSFCSVVGNTGSINTFDPPGAQAYGIGLSGTIASTSVVGNSLTGTSGTLDTSSWTDGGGNSIVDPSAVFLNYPYFGTEMGLKGLTSQPGAAQYYSLFYGWDGSGGSGYAQPAAKTGAGLASMLQMSQYAATSPVTVTAASITSLASLSVPANDPVAGARYKVTAHGTLGTNTSTAPTYICDLRWGGTGGTLITSLRSTATANSPVLTTSLTAVPVLIEGEIEFITATTCVAWLRLTWRPSTTASPTFGLNSITTAVTVTVSSAESLSLNWTWNTAATSTTITIASSAIERVS